MSKIVYSAAALAIVAEAGPRAGGCPKDYAPMKDWDLTRYTGTWYEIHRDSTTPFELGQSCDMADYTATTDGFVTVHNSGWRPI